MTHPFYIAVDFDGTIVDHCYPDIGNWVPGAKEWLLKFQAAGAKLILWTMRCDDGPNGATLCSAEHFLAHHGIRLFDVNKNRDQHTWSTSNKCYAHVYIDDAAAGAPLRINPRMHGRPYLDWDVVGPLVMDMIEAHAKEVSHG